MNKYALLGIIGLIFSACGGEESSESQQTPKARPLAAPFRFHRKIEVKPGLTYDLLTWGRGKDSTSAYLILRSDSTDQQFKAVPVGELSGKPLDAWDMDLDTDGNPELVLQVRLSKELTDLYIHEFDRNGNSAIIRFPSLSDRAMKGFKGKDKIYIKDGNLRRDFLYQDPEDPKAKPVIRTLEYRLRNNAFSINELEKELQK